jgi:glycine/D-amino acid oxidase-like deaminating enzyme
MFASLAPGLHVVEANKVGWGASGRNGGQLIAGISAEKRLAKVMGEQALWELCWAGHKIIRQRVSAYNIDCDLKFGYIDVAIKGRHLRDLESRCRELEAKNFEHEYRLLSQVETRDLIGTDAYIGALLNMGNGHPGQPSRTAQRFTNSLLLRVSNTAPKQSCTRTPDQ